MSIKTVPADTDRRSIHIARFLEQQLKRVGISPTVTPMNQESLRRDVLLNHDFDLYIDRYPARPDPDFLRGMLHSRFGPEPGWQNALGYADLDTDDLLAAQRRQPESQRTTTLWNLQSSLVSNQPFSVIAFPREVRVHRTDRFSGWEKSAIHSTLGYMTLEGVSEGTGVETSTTEPTDSPTATPTVARAEVLKLGTTDARMTRNLNPISVPFRDDGAITGLLYDPLARWVDGEIQPWLAADWTWQDTSGPGRTATVTLGDDATWHDGEDITAADIEFTYRFLADTSLGSFKSPMPAPRFRGRGSLVDTVTVIDRQTVRIEFIRGNEQVARRALTVPLFPKHIWKQHTNPVNPPWLSNDQSLSQALIWRNPNPVGSGPFRFHSWKPDTHLTLEPFDDHFLNADDRPDHLSAYRASPLARLRFEVTPTSRTAVTLVTHGELDATAVPVMPEDVPADLPAAVNRAETWSKSFYHVGYNARRAPLSNPRFRRAVAQLLDKAFIVESVFDGYAKPEASPLAFHDALADRLQWHGEDPELPFPGENGDLNKRKARQAFREAGYRYNGNGKLLAENP